MSADTGEKRKILHIIHGFGTGGVETWLLSAVKYLHVHPELNMQFDFLITGGLPGIFDDEIRKYGSNIYYNKYSLTSFASFKNKFIQILAKNKYLAVHNHQDFISGWHYLLGGKHLPRVRIAHLHNPYNFVRNYVVNLPRWLSFRVGRKLMSRKATAITGTSDTVMDEYGYDKRPFVNKRVPPAYCGFDTEKFKYDDSAKATVCNEMGWDVSVRIALFIGRIGLQSYDTAANQKNPAFAFEVAKELVNKDHNWRFLFVGYKGQTGTMMEKEIQQSALAEAIRFLNIRKDIPRLMSACDVLIFPSLWEGLGMVAVEGQCNGINVIMSKGVPQEAIVCKELVTTMDLTSATDWVNTIVSLHTNQGDRRKYAEVVRNSPFSIENSIKRLISLYEG